MGFGGAGVLRNDAVITMWTAQDKRVWETIKASGCYYVKKEYVEAKYQETAWIFQTAYSYINKHAEKVIEKPFQADSLIWLFRDEKWAAKEKDMVIMKLNIPADQVILFEMRRWNKVLNLSFIGSDNEMEKFQQNLTKIGINDSSDLFTTPYYPLQKKAVTDSWQRLFEIEDIPAQYIQGGAWQLKNEWIGDIIY